MKDRLAIAAVLNTIRSHLELRMAGRLTGLNVAVTVQPPDKIPDDRDVVNLFLYDLRVNPAFRTEPMPGRARAGEAAPPPLPLDLYFLLSVSALENADLNAQRILGLALSVLHDTPVLGVVNLADGAGLYTYHGAERVRLTLHQLTLDELTKIWTGFKGPIVPSVSYQVSVVLMESDRPVVAAPPVLKRGEGDRGPTAVGSPVPPFPVVEELQFAGTDPAQVARRPRRLPAFERGDRLFARGTSLADDNVPAARLRAPGGTVIDLPTDSETPTGLAVTLPVGLIEHAGPHQFWVEVPTRPNRPPLRSAEVPLLVAPVVTNQTQVLTFPAGVPRPPQPFGLTCDVLLLPAQRVHLLVGGVEVARVPAAAPAVRADFDVPELPPGSYPVRLRVDGVDSLPVLVGGEMKVGKEVAVEHL